MPGTTVRIILGIIMMLGMIVTASACGEESATDSGDEVREYADPAAEEILSALSDGDYEKYTQRFDRTMTAAVTEDVFNQTVDLIKAKIGDYVSKEFWKVEEQGLNTIAYYKAEFTEEPAGVEVRVVFQKSKEEMKVSGLWFDSPKLRQ